MKKTAFILLIFTSLVSYGQLNQKTAFGALCAVGNSIDVFNNNLFIVGQTCLPFGTNQIVGNSFFAEFDQYGNLLFIDSAIGGELQNYEATKIVINSLGEKFILGMFLADSAGNQVNVSMFIQKRDQNNQVLWTKEYVDSLSYVSYYIRDADFLANGNIVIAGGFEVAGDSIEPGNPGFPDVDIMLMIVNQNGQLTLTKRFGDNLSQDVGFSISNYGENKIAIGGDKQFGRVDYNSWVILCDYQGNKIDEYISSSDNLQGAIDMTITKDGGIAFISNLNDGLTPGTAYKVYCTKLDSNLNLIWDYSPNANFNPSNYGSAIESLPSGDLIIGGGDFAKVFPVDSGSFYGYIQKLSLDNGDSIWKNNYGILNNGFLMELDRFHDLIYHQNKIYSVGYTFDLSGVPPPQQEMWLVSTDTNGIISSLEYTFDEDLDFKIYPNPFSDYIIIDFNEAEDSDFHFILYDINGRNVLSEVLFRSKEMIRIPNLESGIYFYELNSDSQVIRGKLIK